MYFKLPSCPSWPQSPCTCPCAIAIAMHSPSCCHHPCALALMPSPSSCISIKCHHHHPCCCCHCPAIAAVGPLLLAAVAIVSKQLVNKEKIKIKHTTQRTFA